jgi:hypothetical protein
MYEAFSQLAAVPLQFAHLESATLLKPRRDRRRNGEPVKNSDRSSEQPHVS